MAPLARGGRVAWVGPSGQSGGQDGTRSDQHPASLDRFGNTLFTTSGRPPPSIARHQKCVHALSAKVNKRVYGAI